MIKAMHRVWAGTDPIPARFERYWDKAKAMHPGWEFVTWRGSELQVRAANVYNAQTNFAAMSDILRLEILFKYGGVYVDTDMEFLEPLGDVLGDGDHAVLAMDTAGPTNAFLAAPSGHSFISACLNNIIRLPAEEIPSHQIYNKTGPGLMKRLYPHLQAVCLLHPMERLNCAACDVTDNTIIVHHRTSRWLDRKFVRRWRKAHDIPEEVNPLHDKLRAMHKNERRKQRSHEVTGKAGCVSCKKTTYRRRRKEIKI